jgi:hypothetical protein
VEIYKQIKHWSIVNYKRVKLSLCLTSESLRHEDVWGSECIGPLDFGTSWR